MSTSADRTARVVVIIPALDEEQALPLVLAELPAAVIERVIVCDNGSSDRTAEVARAGGALVVSEPRRGYGRACLTALEVAFGQHPNTRLEPPLGPEDVIVFLDGDHSDYPEELPLVCGPVLRDEADFCLGSRILGGASMDAMLPQAWLGNRLACFLLRWLCGLRATDLGPFRAIRVDALQHLAMQDPDFGWTIEMQLKAHLAELRTLEVPVRYRARIGVSKITGTLSGTLRAGAKILRWIFGWRWKLATRRLSIPKYLRSARTGPR